MAQPLPLLIMFAITVYQCYAICQNGNGCSDICGIEFVDNAVYGCDGVWYNDGLDNAEYLCKSGYHICTSHTEAETLGLTKAQCLNASLIPTNYFYASRQASSGFLTCDESGTDDLFGCGSDTDEGWLWFGDENSQIQCGPFGATLSTMSAGNGGWKYGWEPWGIDHQTELINIEHRHNKEEAPAGSGHYVFNDDIFGGVLCCMNTEMETTEYTEPIADCDGCSQNGTCDVEFVEGAVYGCGGTWEDGGIQNAEYLCGDGYEICADGDTAHSMGLTEDICKNQPSDNHFYATSARSHGWSVCENFNLDGSSSELGYDDVFGCGYSNEGWIKTEYVECGSFSSKISMEDSTTAAYARYGWMIRDIDDENELKGIRHLHKQNTNDTVGGVMCCHTKTEKGEWVPWTIEKRSKHPCKVSNGCTQTIGLVNCDVEFVPDRIYGCSGKFDTQGIQNGEWLCRNGYSICSTSDVVESYGLTKEMCASYPKRNHFYATYSSTENGYYCYDSVSAERSVFGCGLDVESNWLWTISEWTQDGVPVQCGPYTAALTQYNSAEGREFGWNVSVGGTRKEKYFTKHLSWGDGGVLCCRDLGTSTFEPEYQKKLIAFYSARMSEILSLFVTVIIIIVSLYQARKLQLRKGKSVTSRGKCDIPLAELVPVFAYIVYFISVLELTWMIATIWLMVNNHSEVEQNMDCAVRLQVSNVIHIFYKIALYTFLIYKIEGALNGSAYAYHDYVYLSLKIFAIGGVIVCYSLLFVSDYVEYQQFPAVVDGWDCYLSVESWLLYVQGTVDGMASLICCTMFVYKLVYVLRLNTGERAAESRLRSVIFRNTLLSLIALSSTWIFYYIGFQGENWLGWFYSLDFLINNLCIFLMFRSNQTLFKRLCCDCFIFCGSECAERNTHIFGSKSGNEMSKQDSKIQRDSKHEQVGSNTVEMPDMHSGITPHHKNEVVITPEGGVVDTTETTLYEMTK